MTVVSEFITHYAVEIIRTAEGKYSDTTGLWVEGKETKIYVDLCIQPTGQKERLLLPEAVRDKQIIKLYHEPELKITDNSAKIKGDVFTYNSRKYRVFSTSDWNTGNYDIKYYKSYAVLIDEVNSYD